MVVIKRIFNSTAALIMAFLLVFIPVFAFADDVSNASSVSDVSDVSSQAVVSDTSEPETEPVITSGNAIVVMR